MAQKTGQLGGDFKVNSEPHIPHLGGELDCCVSPIWVDIFIAAPLPKVFTYRWVNKQAPSFGVRVVVPFGPRRVVGLVCQSWEKDATPPSFNVRDVENILDNGNLLNDAWRTLIEFSAQYYHYPLGLIALEALPKALRVLNAKGNEPVMVAKGRDYAEALDHLAETASLSSAPSHGQKQQAVQLTPEQSEVVSQLSAVQGFGVHLIYGVTGSGKTEVYLHLLEAHLVQGGQVLVLLPEINLTPAALELYKKRFAHKRVVVLHSGLTELTRTKNWFTAATGKADIVIATRLGVLTPLPQLKLIVVDEEHDPSYRQQEGMKYNARDLAIALAKQRNLPIVLGSATPAMETWQHSLKGSYQRLNMTQRAVKGAHLPQVELIDTQQHKTQNGLSEPVIEALKRCFEAGKQSIVFLNRRGYAPQLACDACGWVAECHACSAYMVWHKGDQALRCHHCGAGRPVPQRCPECGNQDLTGFGRGTQRIEEVLEGLLPQANVLRIDADSTRKKGQMEALLGQAHSGEAHVLVGTQMIAKGHDFAHIGLVVALNTDASLFSQSIKAPERLFAQLMQVAGRAGRREGSARMLVQTRYPDHPLFKALKAHDYPQFAQHELESRQQARMPPFGFQALLRADHKQLKQSLDFLKQAREIGQDLLGQAVYLCDPVPLNVVRVADTERAQMLIESTSRPQLHAFLNAWLERLYEQKTAVRWFLEIDPAEL